MKTEENKVQADVPSTLAASSVPFEHTCCVCGHVWESLNEDDYRAVLKAVEVNKQGPYCGLCLHLEMADRYAKARGYRFLGDALDRWEDYMSEAQNAPAHRPEREQPKT